MAQSINSNEFDRLLSAKKSDPVDINECTAAVAADGIRSSGASRHRRPDVQMSFLDASSSARPGPVNSSHTHSRQQVRTC